MREMDGVGLAQHDERLELDAWVRSIWNSYHGKGRSALVVTVQHDSRIAANCSSYTSEVSSSHVVVANEELPISDGSRANGRVPRGLVLAAIDGVNGESCNGPCTGAKACERAIEVVHDGVVHSVVVSVV